ncbi:hypothetical protein VBD025_14325 [Virgibacillus flavescens]|uniref:hypothetical protein n=1 Tax=Virgibacillus flavescens TaxID=1611422 RepID=UPI003D33774B
MNIETEQGNVAEMKSKGSSGAKNQKVTNLFTITIFIFATQQTFFSGVFTDVVASVIWFSILAAFILHLWIRRQFIWISISIIVFIAGAIYTSMKFL